MKWGDVRRVLGKKLSAVKQDGAKHEQWVVKVDGDVAGIPSVSRGEGEMRGREIGNVARSLMMNEHTFKQLIACPFTTEDYEAHVRARRDADAAVRTCCRSTGRPDARRGRQLAPPRPLLPSAQPSSAPAVS